MQFWLLDSSKTVTFSPLHNTPQDKMTLKLCWVLIKLIDAPEVKFLCMKDSMVLSS